MKLGSVIKLDRTNMATPKKIDNDIMLANRDVIVIFPIYGRFGAIQKLDYQSMVCKTYIFINSNLLSDKN